MQMACWAAVKIVYFLHCPACVYCITFSVELCGSWPQAVRILTWNCCTLAVTTVIYFVGQLLVTWSGNICLHGGTIQICSVDIMPSARDIYFSLLFSAAVDGVAVLLH